MAYSISRAEINGRRRRLFDGAKFQSALFYNGDPTKGGSPSFRYFSGCDVDGSYLVLGKNGGKLLTNGMNFELAKKSSVYPVVRIKDSRSAAKMLRKLCGKGKMGFAANEFTHARYGALRRKAHLELVDAEKEAMAARGRKSAMEIALLRKAALATRKILGGLDPWECRTEDELHRRLKVLALEAGGEASFEPIVSSGSNTRFPHYRAGRARLGNMVLVDFGVKLDGYCADLTRCYFRGGGGEEEKAYRKCRSVFEEMLDGLSECETGGDVGKLGAELMAKHGLPPLSHAIGHGIGIEVHEYPHLGKKSNELVKGAALALEPAAYFPSFGVRYEDVAVNVGGKWKRI